MQTIHNHKTGKTHTGEAVDCAEIMAMNVDWQAKPPEAERPASVTRNDLDAALYRLPAQIEAGEAADVDSTVASIKAQFGELFTDEVELGVRAMFPAATGTGRRSAKVGK